MDVEPPAMDEQFARLDPFDDEGETVKVLQRPDDRALLQQPQLLGQRAVAGFLQHGVACRRDHRYPSADELGLAAHLASQRGPDAAAFRMAHDDDVVDAQILHREFQRRAGAVVMHVRLIGRDQIGDVAGDEQVARTRIQDERRLDP
eukprot:TRINITY_DN13325_c0_g1_i1.p2 TRINITY_DN13325_c0_g1~~TRINITY_DN13325_c0_g1_i1.p2  ORF type:complete len:147 (+),score=21.71 TRINITY_DN13325_c0_g1_i1:436-876(+)